MNTAIDEYERALVQASRRLVAKPRRARIRRFLPLVATVILTACGAAVVARLIPSADMYETPDTIVSCISPQGTVSGPGLTGYPLIDCAAQWHNALGGNPPRLAAYIAVVTPGAVVQSSAPQSDRSDLPPAGSVDVLPVGVAPPKGFRPLPAGWHTNLDVTLLQDLADDINVGFPLPYCLSQSDLLARADALLSTLHLTNWHVVQRRVDAGPSLPGSTCLTAGDSTASLAKRALILTEMRGLAPGVASPLRPSKVTALQVAALRQVRSAAALEQRINIQLARLCATSAQAAAAWRRASRALAPNPELLEQSPAPGCARLIVDEYGGGLRAVYAGPMPQLTA